MSPAVSWPSWPISDCQVTTVKLSKILWRMLDIWLASVPLLQAWNVCLRTLGSQEGGRIMVVCLVCFNCTTVQFYNVCLLAYFFWHKPVLIQTFCSAPLTVSAATYHSVFVFIYAGNLFSHWFIFLLISVISLLQQTEFFFCEKWHGRKVNYTGNMHSIIQQAKLKNSKC